MHKAEIVRCVEHGETNCFQQCNGEHISRAACTCEEKPPYLCPIDAHSIKYLNNNPDWVEEAPIRHAPPPPKPTPQDCGHPADATGRRLLELPGGIRSWLCRACREELEKRTKEENRPATPIELYAKRGKPRGDKMANQQGCTYNIATKKDKVFACGIICEPGETTCPRHKIVAQLESEAKRKREDAAIERKRKKREEEAAAKGKTTQSAVNV